MYPTLYQISEGIGIHTYGLMIMTALLAAFVFSSHNAKKVGIETDELPLMYLLVGLCGILGARLFYFLFSIPEIFFSNPLSFFSGEHGGLVFYGGMIGGVLSGVGYCIWRGIPVWKLADIAGPAIMLGLAFGRVGCFFGGCCHGRPLEDFIEHFRAELGMDASNLIIQKNLASVSTADDFFMALAQSPDAANAFVTTVQSDAHLTDHLAQIGKASNVELSLLESADQLTAAQTFRQLSEGLADIKQADFPAADAVELTNAFSSSLDDGAWQFLWSQGDMLRKVSNAEKTNGAAALNPNALASFKGGDVLSVDGGPGFSLSFNRGVGVGDIHNVPLYPTQVWESVGAFSLFFALAFMWKRLRHFDGQILATMMILYAGLRTSIENFRGDKIRGESWVFGLSTSQLISVVMVIGALIIIAIRLPKGIAKEEPLKKKFDDDFDLDADLL